MLITPNGSIRHTVMINPVESLPPHSVTCREGCAASTLQLADRWITRLHRGPGGLQALHKVNLNETSVLISSTLDGLVMISGSISGSQKSPPHTENWR